MEHVYVKGERVKIIGGMHKRYKHGTFVETYGKKMATVKIDGEKERNLWLSSVAPVPPSKKRLITLCFHVKTIRNCCRRSTLWPVHWNECSWKQSLSINNQFNLIFLCFTTRSFLWNQSTELQFFHIIGQHPLLFFKDNVHFIDT